MKTKKQLTTITKTFEHKKRDNGDTFVIYDKEDNVKELIKSIHFDSFGGCLPNDWIYETVEAAFDNLRDDYDNLDCRNYETFEMVDGMVEIYNADLKRWTLNPFADEYIEKACKELGQSNDFIKMIQYGQFTAIEAIVSAVHNFILDNG